MRRGVIAFAGVDRQFVAFFFGLDVDGVVSAVEFERRRLVRNEVPAADDLLKVGEATIQSVSRAGHKGRAAGEFGECFQRVVANQSAGIFVATGLFVSTIPGTHGVDGDFSLLRSPDRLFEGGFAGVILAIADDHQHAGNRLCFRALGEGSGLTQLLNAEFGCYGGRGRLSQGGRQVCVEEAVEEVFAGFAAD